MRRRVALAALLAVSGAALGGCGASGPSPAVSASEPESAPSAQVAPTPHRADHVRYTHCDRNITVGPHTTCGFADNVFRAFARRVSAEGGSPADHQVEAHSPATGLTYTMSCRTSGGTTLCKGGHSARVRFRLWAAEVYYSSKTSPGEETSEVEEAEEEPEPGSEEPEAGEECANGTYVNSSGNTVCRPEEAPGPPAGATAECADGTYSFSEHRSGTCSYHGGVARWL